MQKHSPYEELFNYYISRFQAGDLKRRLWNTYFPSYEGDVCPGLAGKPLGFKNCISAFLFLGIGIIAASLIFAAELIQGKLSTKKSTVKTHQKEPNNDMRQILQDQPTTNHAFPELALEDVSI